MVQRAVVISTDGKYATIEVSRKGMCEGCHNKSCGSGCPMSSLLSSGGKMTASALNDAGASEGDVIEVETSDGEVLATAALVFALPILLGGLFYTFALFIETAKAIRIVSAVVGFLLPFPFLKIAENARSRHAPKLRIMRIINDNEHPL